MPMPSRRGKRVIQQIVSVFETGTPEGDYGAVAILSDGAGISYGLHQVTDGGGNLAEVMARYVDRRGLYADEIGDHLPRILNHESRQEDPKNPSPWCRSLMNSLQLAGREDPLMREIQDDVFDEKYWQPAAKMALEMGLILPLSWGLIYDSCIQSGPGGVAKIRAMFPEVPPSKGGDEREWSGAYVRARWSWLASYPNERVRVTKARMEAFQDLIDGGNWRLKLPLKVLGRTISRPLA